MGESVSMLGGALFTPIFTLLGSYIVQALDALASHFLIYIFPPRYITLPKHPVLNSSSPKPVIKKQKIIDRRPSPTGVKILGPASTHIKIHRQQQQLRITTLTPIKSIPR